MINEEINGIIFSSTGVPVDENQRQVFVSQVATIQESILKPKFLSMIDALHKLLEVASNSREEDLSIKGAIYAMKEIILWGDQCVNENIANQQKIYED